MRKILSILIGMIFLFPLVLSTNIPLPIAGTFKGLNIPVDVRITNLRTGISVTERTNENDELVYDWLNSPNVISGNKFESSDSFEIRVLICDSSPNCVKTVKFSGGIILINFDLTGENLPCPELPVCEECQVCETCEVCETCDSCDSCCPEEGITLGQVLIYVFSSIGLLSVGAGVQYTITKRKDGKVTMTITKHKHFGVDNYHSVYTLHMKPDIRHPKGMVNPQYKDGKFTGGS